MKIGKKRQEAITEWWDFLSWEERWQLYEFKEK